MGKRRSTKKAKAKMVDKQAQTGEQGSDRGVVPAAETDPGAEKAGPAVKRYIQDIEAECDWRWARIEKLVLMANSYPYKGPE